LGNGRIGKAPSVRKPLADLHSGNAKLLRQVEMGIAIALSAMLPSASGDGVGAPNKAISAQ